MKLHRFALIGSALLVWGTGCPDEEAETEPSPDPNDEAEEEAQADESEEPAEVPSMRDIDVETADGESVEARPDDVEWEEGPGSFDEGSEFAVLEGDPGEEGYFAMQIKMPDGFVINPHTHPNVERVTVLQGTFNLGMGEEEVDEDATEAYPEGTYVSMPPGMAHFAIAEGETIIQLTSVGPWEIDYIDPDDDPRN